MARSSRSVTDSVPDFPTPGDVVEKLPGPIRRGARKTGNIIARSWDDVKTSIVRNGWPTSVRGRSLAIMNSFFLHLPPIRPRPDAIKMSYTFGLGGLTFFLF